MARSKLLSDELSIGRRLRRTLRGIVSPEPEPAPGEPAEIPWPAAESPWLWLSGEPHAEQAAACNICFWSGDSHVDPGHSEAARCPRCGSIARDRFLFLCFISRCPEQRYRVLETSPRLGDDYRAAMREWFSYRASDFDQRAHKADISLDLQKIELEDCSIDLLLTPHVLEHVPDTDLALREIHRILAPGGRMYLQVPVLQGRTAPPVTPEFHGDNTPVFWRFGPDLTARLRAAGFRTQLLCSEGFRRLAACGARGWPDPVSPEFDVESILGAVEIDDLCAVADDATTARLALYPGYMFLTWECRKASS